MGGRAGLKLTTISLVAAACLSACVHTPVRLAGSHIKLVASKHEHLRRKQTSAQRQSKLSSAQAASKEDCQAISVLLAESDAALRQSQRLQAQVAACKDKKVRQALQLKAMQAQNLANMKAQALVRLKGHLDEQLAAIAQLEQAGESAENGDAGRLRTGTRARSPKPHARSLRQRSDA